MIPMPNAHPRGLLAVLLWTAFSLGTLLPLASGLRPAAAYEQWWVQSHRTAQLWSGPDSRAIPFGEAPQWSYFLVVAPQQGSRLHVWDPRTGNYAYVDAAAVGPSSAPPTSLEPRGPAPALAHPVRTPPRVAAGQEPWWVSNYQETDLWSSLQEDATSLARLPQFRRFMVVEPQQGNRLHVWYPETDTIGFVDAAVMGASGPSVWLKSHPVKPVRRIALPGRAVGDKTVVRNLPVYDDETEIRYTPNNTPLNVEQLMVTPDGTEWYTVGDAQYILASEVRLPRPVERTLPGRWIDADLTEPAMVTAYEDDKIVYSALAIKGVSAYSTPKGIFSIWQRVEDETMDSATLGIPRNAPGGYYLKNVLYTQYFTYDGASLHYNYWLGTFGRAGSHGCLGLNYEDAKWFWDWASIGTPVAIR